MDKLIALLQFVLALFGVDLGGQTLVHRIDSDGTTGVYSRTHVEAGVALFECLRSDSGQCHYVLYPRGCAVGGTPGSCDAVPLDRFALASGDSRQRVGLPGFQLCVSAGGATQARDCSATGR